MLAEERNEPSNRRRSEVSPPERGPGDEQLVEAHPRCDRYASLGPPEREDEMPSARRDLDHIAGACEPRPAARNPGADGSCGELEPLRDDMPVRGSCGRSHRAELEIDFDAGAAGLRARPAEGDRLAAEPVLHPLPSGHRRSQMLAVRMWGPSGGHGLQGGRSGDRGACLRLPPTPPG
jgi:hypothetical protein